MKRIVDITDEYLFVKESNGISHEIGFKIDEIGFNPKLGMPVDVFTDSEDRERIYPILEDSGIDRIKNIVEETNYRQKKEPRKKTPYFDEMSMAGSGFRFGSSSEIYYDEKIEDKKRKKSILDSISESFFRSLYIALNYITKNDTVAYLTILVAFGLFGGHYLYLGQTKKFIVRLAITLFILPLACLLWLIDILTFIMFPSKVDRIDDLIKKRKKDTFV